MIIELDHQPRVNKSGLKARHLNPYPTPIISLNGLLNWNVMPSRNIPRMPLRFSSPFHRPKSQSSPASIPSLLRQPRPRPRFQSTSPPPSSSSSRARIDRILSRLPRFLHPYTNGLRNAPVSHITSFLILHEITAVVPLVGLAGLFHYTNWLPEEFADGRWVREGVERFGRYFGRKGWFGFEREEKGQGQDQTEGTRGDVESEEKEIERRWHVGEKGSRILVEVATAYAITKVLLPLRIVVSVWATPWFARAVLGRVTGLFGRRKHIGTKAAEGMKKAP